MSIYRGFIKQIFLGAYNRIFWNHMEEKVDLCELTGKDAYNTQFSK